MNRTQYMQGPGFKPRPPQKKTNRTQTCTNLCH